MIFQLDSVSCRYPGHPRPALNQISLSVPDGSFTAVTGSNGSGKSTLLKLLCGILKPEAGTLTFSPGDHSGRRSGQIAYVPQKQDLLFSMTAGELVATGRTPYLGWLGLLAETDHLLIDRSMHQTDIYGLKNQPVSQLSGGEIQRVWIARALAQQASVIILDEPTAHLDLKHQLDVFKLLKKLQQEMKTTVILACHDLSLAASFSTHSIILTNGSVFRSGPPETVFTGSAIREAFRIPVSILKDQTMTQICIHPDAIPSETTKP